MIAASLALMLALQEPGKTDVIKCAADPAQNYACYVPKAYTKAKKWPILYCYSPNAQGGYFVDLYRDVCEEVGWIVVGSNNSQNGPGEPIQAAMKAMWADARQVQHRRSAHLRLRLLRRSAGLVLDGEPLSRQFHRVIAIGAGTTAGEAPRGWRSG